MQALGWKIKLEGNFAFRSATGPLILCLFLETRCGNASSFHSSAIFPETYIFVWVGSSALYYEFVHSANMSGVPLTTGIPARLSAEHGV